ncbi:hypothetical protein NHX12_017336 [Muraenolepis orangiensis]|uniref:Zinc transporter ZIP6 n=1 Tax=Muraenolepis orangiensis TaxID=630683 RepID=A0A9Q0D9F7_9TELE|nr:hypothetical protein NHX12_017336 [Muraenolepis orangiensis]
MPRTTVHRIVHRVTEEVVDIRDIVIYLPKTPEDLEAICRGFAGLARHRAFNKAGGAIDGCHVRIVLPGGPGGRCYVNRKLFASITLQAVCDHQGRFIDTYVGWPGSVHDARVLRHSPLYKESVYPPPGHFILADGGYPCLQQPLPLITPYKRPIRGVAAQRFNAHHSRARSIIERAFGMMKTRFRAIFLQALEVKPTFVPLPVSPVGLRFPGDFAVLLKAGMTVRQAILYNALSALMAFLGMAVGILIGHYADHVSMWVFALTAGLFMYVALVDMLQPIMAMRSVTSRIIRVETGLAADPQLRFWTSRRGNGAPCCQEEDGSRLGSVGVDVRGLTLFEVLVYHFDIPDPRAFGLTCTIPST